MDKALTEVWMRQFRIAVAFANAEARLSETFALYSVRDLSHPAKKRHHGQPLHELFELRCVISLCQER